MIKGFLTCNYRLITHFLSVGLQGKYLRREGVMCRCVGAGRMVELLSLPGYTVAFVRFWISEFASN